MDVAVTAGATAAAQSDDTQWETHQAAWQALLSAPQLAAGAAALATALATRLQCERVFVGWAQGHHMRLLAASHGAHIESHQPLVHAVGSAMDEAVDQAGSVCLPPVPDDAPRITRAHAALAGALGLGAALTVPVFHQGQAIAALTFAGPLQGGFDAAFASRMEALAQTLAPLLELKIEQHRPWLQRQRRRARHALAAMPATRRRLWAAGGVLALGALLAAAFLPLAHDIAVPTRLEGRVQRIVAAPADGYLKAVHVRAGDEVKAGQLLAEMADEDLLLERRRWEAEVAKHETAYADAMARADRAALVLAESRAAEARAQLALADQQLARTHLTAPFDALVIAGDLSQQLAAPLRRGDLLFTLTPSRELRVMLQVDERDAASVRAGARGSLTLSALPEQRFALEVERVLPVARVEGSRNVFEAQARLLPGAGDLNAALRPGMQGVAQVQAGRAPLIWLATHRLIDWLRLQWWTWLG